MMESLSGWLEAGGPIVVILLVLSVYSVALAVMKLIQFWGVLAGQKDREAAISAWRRGSLSEARNILDAPQGPINRVINQAMNGLGGTADKALVREEVHRHALYELETLGRHLRTLEVIAVVSPLMGLLGTVMGMIESFQQLDMAGGTANASVLASGIWQALLTTAMGLIVAIPASVVAYLLGARLDRARHAMEDGVTRLFTAGHMPAE